MSDGISDGNAVSELASSVENRAWDLVAAIYRARQGYRGLTPGDGVELANEKLQLFGLRLMKERNFTEMIETHGPFTRRSGSFHEERGRREMKREVVALLEHAQLDDDVKKTLIRQVNDELSDERGGS
jgi:hypothetical protein